jgi:hypothetical protein
VLVDGWRPGLHEEDIGAADRLAVAHVRLVVREGIQLDLAEVDPEALGDPLGELGVRAAREHHQPLLRRERDRVARLQDGLDRGAFEPGQRLLNRSAFHRALP